MTLEAFCVPTVPVKQPGKCVKCGKKFLFTVPFSHQEGLSLKLHAFHCPSAASCFGAVFLGIVHWHGIAWTKFSSVQLKAWQQHVDFPMMCLENQNHDLTGGITIGILDNSLSLALSVGCGCGSLCMKHVNEASEVWFVFTYFLFA